MEKEEEPHLLQGEGQQAEQARWAGGSVWEQERQRRDTDLGAGGPQTGSAPPLILLRLFRTVKTFLRFSPCRESYTTDPTLRPDCI